MLVNKTRNHGSVQIKDKSHPSTQPQADLQQSPAHLQTADQHATAIPTRLSGCDVKFTGGEGGVRESKDFQREPAYPMSFSSTDSWGP